jgi:RNA polymerase sigma factor (sigma-70 family)
MTETGAAGRLGRRAAAAWASSGEDGHDAAYAQDRERLWHAVLAHRDRLLRLSRARTSSAQDAEDCVQEAMLRCMEFANLDESRLGPFLTTVTLRLCADRHRERSNEERLRRKLGPGERDAAGPEEAVCDRGEAAWLASRFGELTPRQQEIVRAREAGLSCAEVASRFRMSYVSVESSLARARSRFREALAQTMGVLWPVSRWTTAAEVATVTAAIAVGGLVAPTVRPAGRAPVPQAAAAAPAVQRHPKAPRPAAVVPPVTRRRQQAAPASRGHVQAPRRAQQAAWKQDQYTKDHAFQGYSLGTDDRNDAYRTDERVGHCVSYGVTARDGIRCRYPDENGGPR